MFKWSLPSSLSSPPSWLTMCVNASTSHVLFNTDWKHHWMWNQMRPWEAGIMISFTKWTDDMDVRTGTHDMDPQVESSVSSLNLTLVICHCPVQHYSSRPASVSHKRPIQSGSQPVPCCEKSIKIWLNWPFCYFVELKYLINLAKILNQWCV